ncbi:hypothetical protein ACP70R_000534 [Stipagrostis hirtigluma subsp. patula]
MHGKDIVENPKLDAALRYKYLCQKFLALASRAADFEECFMLVEEELHSISKKVEEKIRETPKDDVENSNVQAPFSLPTQFSHVAGLKKKQRQKGGSKRKKSWVDKLQKATKNKGAKKNKVTTHMQQEENASQKIEPQAHERNMEPNAENCLEYESLGSYTQLLMSSSVDVNNPHYFEWPDGWQL